MSVCTAGCKRPPEQPGRAVDDVLLLALAGSLAVAVYAYVGYPAMLVLRRLFHRASGGATPLGAQPRVSILLPVHNEETTIGGALEHLLQLDYPADCRQILVVSDASTDRTDEIVQQFADRGVELLRLPRRGGKTAAENAAYAHLRGDIIVSTDASVRVPRHALTPLLASFGDPSVGVASGRDISVGGTDGLTNPGESGYVGYEMWVRDLETRLYGIVGASGCLYAMRADLRAAPLPEALSCDFAAALIAREHGYRAVSVREATCFVPRVASLRHEYRRKVRTITRGIATLFYKRRLLNPLRYGVFAWMLFSHKLCRWLVPWAALAATAALGVLSGKHPWAAWVLGGVGLTTAAGAVGWAWPVGRRAPRALTVAAYAIAGNVAVVHAWINVVRGQLAPTWEPSRRTTMPPSRFAA